ncbi:MAG: threonine synthase [Terrimonas sp.]|nr:threonine synthase [Terrimonas sp.]
MKFYSLHKQSPAVTFKEAAINGQAPDKGLYFPEHIPVFDKSFFDQIGTVPDEDIAFRVIRPYTGQSIPDDELYRIVKETIDFPIPLVKLNEEIYSLELFHGPTLAFKDIGARFMSRCLGYFSKDRKEKVIVLVATSGDTGGAVADGFYNVPGVEVIILYPAGKVSAIQEKQLTTLGNNIHALEVNGNFDDCQDLVKQAFTDRELSKHSLLTSANSINVARWLPQQFYYFFAWKQWAFKNQLPVIAVPSGNFGNICAGLLAHASGLPVKHFIAACNVNDVVPRFLATGRYEPRKAIATLSNAMDVGNPSNFVRILEIFEKQQEGLKQMLSSYSITDEETIDTLKYLYQRFGYVADPHGAVGFLALTRYLNDHPREKGIFLETAHPVKFLSDVEQAIGAGIMIPPNIKSIMEKKSQAISINVDYEQLRACITNVSNGQGS